MKIILSIGILLLVSGCAFWPFGLFPSWGWLAADITSYATTGKTTTDHAISIVAAKDCALFRLVKGEKICVKSNDELALLMSDMSCNNFTFDEDSNPFCENNNFENLN